MALVTSTGDIPSLEYEYHTITIDSIGQARSNTFTCHLQNPLKNVVQARLVATNINTTTATKHCYISIDELNSVFNDRASNVYEGQSSMSMLRSSFASIVGDGTTSFNSKDNYPIVTQFVNPIRSIARFTINIRNQNGVPIVPSSPPKNNFIILRFVCRKPNL